MAKPRTREDCLAAVQAEGAWRKREIIALRTTVDSSGEHQAILRRASVVMIYAHWEGFVKKSSLIYIDFLNDLIARKQVLFCDHFVQLMIWAAFRRKGDHPFLRNPVPFLEAVNNVEVLHESLPIEMVDTEDNLKSRVLRKISSIINIDYTGFETKEKLIDESLLGKRNKIAHGERISVSHDEYVEIDSEIRTLIAHFQEKIEHCIQFETYRKVLHYEG